MDDETDHPVLNLATPLVFIDLESTGTRPFEDRIVQLAAGKLHPQGEWEEREWLIQPGIPISPAATAVHGISTGDILECPRFDQVADEILAFLESADLAGYCIKRFDLPLLLQELKRCDRSLSLAGRRVIDCYQIVCEFQPRTLRAMYSHYCRRPPARSHQALADVRTTRDLLQAQLQTHPELPRDLAELHDRYGSPDLMGRLALQDGVLTFAFGKHRGRPVVEVAQLDPGYLHWLLRAEFLEDFHARILQVLESLHPEFPD